MPSGKITWADIKNHLHYGKWLYLVIGLVAVFLFDLVFTMTEYRPPSDRRVEIELVQAGAVDEERLDAMAREALPVIQARDETLEEISFLSILYSGDAEVDFYGAQKFSVMIAAREGDIWIMPRGQFESLHAQGAFRPLGEYVASGQLRVGEAELDAFMLPAASDERDENGDILAPDGPVDLYGLPVSLVPAIQGSGYYLEDAVITLMNYSDNPDTAIWTLDYLMNLTVEDAP